MDKGIYIYEFHIKESDETFRSFFSTCIAKTQKTEHYAKHVVSTYNCYAYVTKPIPGYVLMKREEIFKVKGSDGLVDVEQNVLAFVPNSSIEYLLIMDESDLTEDELFLLHIKPAKILE